MLSQNNQRTVQIAAQQLKLETMAIAMHCNFSPPNDVPVVLGLKYEAHDASSCQISAKSDNLQLSYQSWFNHCECTMLPHTPAPEILSWDLSHCKCVDSSNVITSGQSAASYAAADLVIALNSFCQKAQENAQNINLSTVHHQPSAKKKPKLWKLSSATINTANTMLTAMCS